MSGQPKGFRGTRAGLDPQGTARALRKGIDRMFAQHPALADQRRDALHYAHLALWTLFDRTVYWSLARTHLILAAAYRPAMALEARRWRTLARLTLGPALTRVWRARTRQEAS